MSFSVASAVSGFLSDFAGSLTSPKTYRARASAGFGRATAYFLVLMAVACLLKTVGDVGPVSWSILAGDDKFESAFNEIPDFTVADGKLNITGNATQPIRLGNNFVIDTTGNTTEVPVDEKGEGVLITEDAIISKKPFKEDRTDFKDLEQVVKNKQDLIDFLKNVMLLAIPVMMVLGLLANVIMFALSCGFSLLFCTMLGLAAAKFRDRRVEPAESAIVSIYAQTPVFVLGVAGAAFSIFVPAVGSFLFVLAGMIWAALICLSVEYDKNG